MIEYLGPVVSVFKLFLEGISKSAKAITSNKDKAIKRKLIEMQFSIEDIIDNAKKISSLIQRSSGKTQAENRKLVTEIKAAIYDQISKIRMLIAQLSDDNSQKILKIFIPDIRRDITLLTQMKLSALYLVLSAMDEAMQKTIVSKDGLKVTINSALIGWDHQKFVDDSKPYLIELFQSSKKAKVLLPRQLNHQKKVIRALTLCSKKLSTFISENINISDAIGIASKKKRK